MKKGRDRVGFAPAFLMFFLMVPLKLFPNFFCLNIGRISARNAILTSSPNFI